MEVPLPLALAQNWTPSRESKHHKIPQRDGAQGMMKKDIREIEGPQRENPRMLSGTWVNSEGAKGGANRQVMTAYVGLRRRDDLQRLAGGRGGQYPGGWRSAPGEEVGSGQYRECNDDKHLLMGVSRREEGKKRERSRYS